MPEKALALDLLCAAIAEVAHSPNSQRKLARAACVRPTCESEWVYELDGTTVMESVRPGVAVTEIAAGPGVFAGHTVHHDALIVSWDTP
jgi:hypothetical protein